MRAQKHSSSLIGWRCQQSRRPSWRPREGENMVGRLGGGSCAGVFKVKKKRWFCDGNRSVGLFWYVCCSLNGIWSTYWLKMQLANHSMTSESKHQSDWYPENSLACWIKHNHNSQRACKQECHKLPLPAFRCWNPPLFLGQEPPLHPQKFLRGSFYWCHACPHVTCGWKILTGSGGSFGPHAIVLNLRVFHFRWMELHLIINFPYMAVKSR